MAHTDPIQHFGTRVRCLGETGNDCRAAKSTQPTQIGSEIDPIFIWHNLFLVTLMKRGLSMPGVSL